MTIYRTNAGSFVAEQRARDGVLCISEASTQKKAIVATFEAVKERNAVMRERRFEVVK